MHGEASFYFSNFLFLENSASVNRKRKKKKKILHSDWQCNSEKRAEYIIGAPGRLGMIRNSCGCK